MLMKSLVFAALAFAALAPALDPAPSRGSAEHRLGPLSQTVTSCRAWARRRARRARSAHAIPEALELLARALRSGASVRTAVDTVANDLPDADLVQVASRVHGGLSLADALDRWADGHADRQAAASLLVLGHSSGAAMAASLDRAAASLRQRHAVGDEIRALTAQTRVSGVVVAVAPAAFGAVVALVDYEAVRVLFTTGIGLVSLAVGMALECLGVWWMSRLSRGVASWA